MSEGLDLEQLPGGEIVARGLDDLAKDIETAEASAVLMAAARLREAGVAVPAVASGAEPAAHRLYELLAERHGDAAHSSYNATLRRMASFARAAERARAG